MFNLNSDLPLIENDSIVLLYDHESILNKYGNYILGSPKQTSDHHISPKPLHNLSEKFSRIAGELYGKKKI
jgi:hypothetical protein